jgi:hypothetical protein
MIRLCSVYLAALVVACGSTPALSCDGASNGERLVVVCNAPVEPVPEACERVADATYECNWLHATAEQCATFPGICR